MRVILLMVALVICFLFGVMYGMDNQQTADVRPFEQKSEEIVADRVTDQRLVEADVETDKEMTVVAETSSTPAYKAASALEAVVDFLYEIIVGILYQVSKLFF